MSVSNFQWDHWIDEKNKEVWVYIPGGYPATMGLPLAIQRTFPGYKGSICSNSFLQKLKANEQEKSD